MEFCATLLSVTILRRLVTEKREGRMLFIWVALFAFQHGTHQKKNKRKTISDLIACTQRETETEREAQ